MREHDVVRVVPRTVEGEVGAAVVSLHEAPGYLVHPLLAVTQHGRRLAAGDLIRLPLGDAEAGGELLGDDPRPRPHVGGVLDGGERLPAALVGEGGDLAGELLVD